MLVLLKIPHEIGSVRRRVVMMQRPLFCRQRSGRSLRTFSRSRLKTSQQYMELTVWHARTNSLVSKKMMSMLLILLLTCLAFFGLP
jgi:hypothetical protein